NSGTLTASAAINLPAATHLNLTSGGDIVFNPGSLNTGGGALTLAPGSGHSVQPITIGIDANVGPAALGFASGSNLSIAINGTTADSQYSQLNVVGDINVSGVNLVLSGNLHPGAGQTFAIVN